MAKVQIISAADFREFQTDLNKMLKGQKPAAKKLTGPQKQIQQEKLKKTEHLSKLFMKILESEGLPLPIREHHFALPRKFRFDFAWLDHRIALEVEGGVWTNGGHTRGKGFTKDVEKYNMAGKLGWTVLRCVPDELKNQISLLKTILINKHKTNHG